MSLESRIQLVDKINDDPIYGQRFGELIIIALDRHDFLSKSVYLARACKYFENGYIDRPTFIRFKGLIERIDIEDLSKLEVTPLGILGHPTSRKDPSLFQFHSLGLTDVRTANEMIPPMTFIDHDKYDKDEVHVSLTNYGEKFIRVISDVVV